MMLEDIYITDIALTFTFVEGCNLNGYMCLKVNITFCLNLFCIVTRYEMCAEWNILAVSHNHSNRRMIVTSVSVFRQICLFGVELFPAARQTDEANSPSIELLCKEKVVF
jgi:hypothetical protein